MVVVVEVVVVADLGLVSFFGGGTVSHVAQAGLKFTIWPRLVLIS